ncbi:AH receptor-interacting protein [Cylas formicarius]|uniref:AH receptor-interacting protein n=1 Tax=Cylas formicarius TaxID=197179 RepID=UPI002958D74D|nr:AH receptor-interacting protein [Cylas formicarius]
MSQDEELIVKKVLHAGVAPVAFRAGTKIFFHFRTELSDPAGTVLDDSRLMGAGEPLHIILGKQFKLEVWEAILQKMALREVARFTVDKSLVAQYPFVSKTLRDMHRQDKKQTHCCAMSLQGEGVGYDDLNSLLKRPSDLEFTMEIVEVQQPEQYEKETWQMDEREKIDLVPKLKQQGNEEYGRKEYHNAADLYAKAIGILEQLMLKHKPHDVDWDKLNRQKLPLLLNYAQCKLHEGDYYAAIEHCSEVLKHDDGNVKAYFRRAKAHVSAWNPLEARRDLEKVMELDPALVPLARRELAALDELRRAKDLQDKEKLKKMFT